MGNVADGIDIVLRVDDMTALQEQIIWCLRAEQRTGGKQKEGAHQQTVYTF